MSKNVIIAPSVLSADFSDIRGALGQISGSGAPWVHLDVMDGSFVPPITFGSKFVSDMRRHSELFFDAHLMVREPQSQIDAFAKAGCQAITVHAEACTHLNRVLAQIKASGCRAGVSIVPSTPVSAIEPVLDVVDIVLVMTVDPGFGGQALVPYTVGKIKTLSRLRGNRQFLISADGGINEKTMPEVFEAGIDVAVTGSSFFASADKAGFVSRMSAGMGAGL